MRTELLGYLALGCLLVTSASCSSAQSTPRASLRPDVGEVPAELRSDYESFVSNCNKCHDLERALAAPVTDNRHWDIYVAKMMRTAGSAISAAEAPSILRFLYWYTDRKTGRVPAEAAKTNEEATAPPKEESNEQPAAPSGQSVTTEPQGESAP